MPFNITGRSGNTTNVYLNRDPIEATLPVQAIQTTVNDPIIISLKGLSGIGASNANKIIKVNSAGDSLIYDVEPTADTTIESNFGTATTTNPVKVGNIAGQSIGLELHFNLLKLINTSGVQIATFTPVSNTCDLDLNGGLLKTFTASTNATWQGIPIAYNYGGTGLSTLSGQSGKILQVNSSSNGYTFTTLPSASQWTLNGSNLYPNSSITNVVINSTTNTDNRSLLINGDCDIKDKLFLSSTSNAEIQIDNNSAKGIHFNSATNQGFKLYADNSISGGAVINVLLVSTSTPLLQLESSDTPYHKFSVGNSVMNGSSNFTRSYFQKAPSSNIGRYIENNFTNNTFNLRTYTSTYDEVFMSIDLSNNNQRTTTFEKCSNFIISSGAGSNGDCSLIIRADTDDGVETANPIIRLQQDGAAVEAKIELTSNNDLRIGSEYSNRNVSIYTNSGTFQITNSLTNDNNMANITNLLAQFKSTQTQVEELITPKIIATNNTSYTIASSSYGWQFRGSLGKQISIADIVNAPYIGCNNTYNYLINISNIGDAYTISGTSTSNLTHTFTGKIQTNTIEAVNDSSNTIVSNTTYGWEFKAGTLSRQISIPDITDYPFIGCDSNHNYEIHLNNIGDAYTIVATNTSDMAHTFTGKTIIKKELVANVDNASSNGRIGFQNNLAGYSGSIFPTLISEQTFGYFMSNTTPITGTGGSYDGYWGQGGVGGASDRRLKKNINTIENPIDIIKKLRGVNFEWICDNKPKGIQIGYIAQEVKEVIPSIVDFLPTKDECCEDGTWGVQPANISAILVEGIKAQQEQINTLTTELDTYKSLMNKLINAPSFKSFKESLA